MDFSRVRSSAERRVADANSALLRRMHPGSELPDLAVGIDEFRVVDPGCFRALHVAGTLSDLTQRMLEPKHPRPDLSGAIFTADQQPGCSAPDCLCLGGDSVALFSGDPGTLCLPSSDEMSHAGFCLL